MTIPSILLTAGFALLAVAPPASALQTEGPFLPLKSQDAFARAEKEGLPVLIWFSDPELPECLRMARIFEDEGLTNWIKKNTICIQVHPKEEPKLASHYAAQAPPATVLVQNTRQLIERLDGVVSADKFLSTFELAITGLRTAVLPEGESAKDPYAWLAWGNHLFTLGNSPEECLNAYTWVLDHAEETHPGLRARSLEFLLKRIAYLKLGTDLATPRLIQRRADIQRLIVGGKATEQNIYELIRFNFWLRQEKNTTDFFAQLTNQDEVQKGIREILIWHDLEQIIAWRNYEAVRELVPDPKQMILQRFEALAASQKDASKPAPLLAYGLRDSRSRIVGDAALHYEALLFSGLGKQASDLKDVVLSRVTTGRAYVIFMAKSNRLKLYTLSKSTGDAGMEVLGPKGQKMVGTALVRSENLAKADVIAAEKTVEDGR